MVLCYSNSVKLTDCKLCEGRDLMYFYSSLLSTSSTMPGYIITFCNNNLQIEKVIFTITWEAFTKHSCPLTKFNPSPTGFIPIALKRQRKEFVPSIQGPVAKITWIIQADSLLSLNYLSNCIIVCFTLVAQIFSSAHRCGNWLVAREHETHCSKAYVYKQESV